MVERFIEARQIAGGHDAHLAHDMGDSIAESLGPSVTRMLRTLRMARVRLTRRDPDMAMAELDKLEEMLLALSDTISPPTRH